MGLKGKVWMATLHTARSIQDQASDRKEKQVLNIHMEALILDWSGLCPNPLNKSTSPASKWPDTEAHSRRTWSHFNLTPHHALAVEDGSGSQ